MLHLRRERQDQRQQNNEAATAQHDQSHPISTMQRPDQEENNAENIEEMLYQKRPIGIQYIFKSKKHLKHRQIRDRLRGSRQFDSEHDGGKQRQDDRYPVKRIKAEE